MLAVRLCGLAPVIVVLGGVVTACYPTSDGLGRDVAVTIADTPGFVARGRPR